VGLLGRIRIKLKFEFGIFPIRRRKVENGWNFEYEFCVSYFELNLNLFKNMNLIGSNVENDVGWYRIFLYFFHPYISINIQ
jgi:hypothetical protein